LAGRLQAGWLRTGGSLALTTLGRREKNVKDTDKDIDTDAEFLLLPEVAALTRMSPETLRWLRHVGTGPPCAKVGRRLLFKRSDVLEWFAELKREQADTR
jgi:predicted DNA-binding transcriptional regulator AlpA